MLRRLDPEDQRKIHSEINQLVNQRFLLTTAAVTVFGIISAWNISKYPTSDQISEGAFRCAVSILLTLILFALFILSHLLATILRTYASYLRITGQSKWEQDWKEYRSAGYSAYTKAIAILFLILGITSFTSPYGLALIYSVDFKPLSGYLLVAAVGLVYVVFVIGIGFFHWFDREKIIDQRWQGILANLQSSNDATIENNSPPKT